MKYQSSKFKFDALPKYPAINRDLAMLVADTVSAAEIEKIISKHGGEYFKSVTLFDIYTGKQIDAGKKSMAFTMQFQSNEKTLTDAEIDEAFNRIVENLRKEFDAELRA